MLLALLFLPLLGFVYKVPHTFSCDSYRIEWVFLRRSKEKYLIQKKNIYFKRKISCSKERVYLQMQTVPHDGLNEKHNKPTEGGTRAAILHLLTLIS